MGGSEDPILRVSGCALPVIAKDDGKVKLYCNGIDTVMCTGIACMPG